MTRQGQKGEDGGLTKKTMAIVAQKAQRHQVFAPDAGLCSEAANE
jgi:hypothetical protein